MLDSWYWYDAVTDPWEGATPPPHSRVGEGDFPVRGGLFSIIVNCCFALQWHILALSETSNGFLGLERCSGVSMGWGGPHLCSSRVGAGGFFPRVEVLVFFNTIPCNGPSGPQGQSHGHCLGLACLSRLQLLAAVTRDVPEFGMTEISAEFRYRLLLAVVLGVY